jgi:hypothetical protein
LAADDLAQVAIFLEKHGAFYHPARIAVTAFDQHFSLAVNVATSKVGQKALFREALALQQLNETRPFGWLPAVYAVDDDALPMFLADWFDGFHEFHLTRKSENEGLSILVWDGAEKPCLLSDAQTACLYRSMAMILTACHDPVSSCQIFPWHHAAGDFVVRVEGSKTEVKLITVRDYIPLTAAAAGPADESELLETLLLFFLHLTLRMRLDRLDGISEVVWAPDRCIDPTIEGFFQGLDLTARLNGFPEAFPEMFRQYLRCQPIDNVTALAAQITTAVFGRHSEERQVIENHLEKHVQQVIGRRKA